MEKAPKVMVVRATGNEATGVALYWKENFLEGRGGDRYHWILATANGHDPVVAISERTRKTIVYNSGPTGQIRETLSNMEVKLIPLRGLRRLKDPAAQAAKKAYESHTAKP